MSKIIKATLEDVCLAEKGAIISGPFGSNISSKYFVSSGVPVIRGNNLSLTYDKFYDKGFVFVTKQKADELNCYAKKNDLIFTAAGTIGQVGIIPDSAQFEEYVISNKQIRATLDCKKINFLYAYYWFSSPWIQEKLIKSNKGSTVPLLTLAEVKLLPISYPESLTEQIAIAEAIEMFSRKIELNKAINDNLEQQLRTTYDYWFTQFDFPDENGKPYRSSGGKMVWNDELKREIPEGWIVMPLLNYITWESNSQPPKSEFVYTPKEGYVRFIQNRDYDSDGYKTYIPYKSSLSIVDKFDIVMDKYGDAGAIRYGIAGAFNVALGKICVHDADMQEYIRSYLGSAAVYNYLHNSCMASTRASLNESNLSFLKIIVPSKEVLIKYQEIAHKMRSLILQCADQNRQCIAIRDWLLPMLMNGQATVAD